MVSWKVYESGQGLFLKAFVHGVEENVISIVDLTQI
jgi:hypothetical protein